MERKVRVDSLPTELRGVGFRREFCETWHLWNDIWEKGTRRDMLIVELYENAVHIARPIRPALSREEFQKFRSKIEPLSDGEIAEKLSQGREKYAWASRKDFKTFDLDRFLNTLTK